MGETSRSIQERALEHLGGARRGVERNHMIVHQHLEHPGEPPSFVFKVISSHKTALNRQIKEAVRIRRRGGAARILNARGEFNRSHITRLVVEQEEEGSKQERLHLEQVEKDELNQRLMDADKAWVNCKTRELELMERKRRRHTEVGGEEEEGEGKISRGGRRKKLKFSRLEDDWGVGGDDEGEEGGT